jgi:hypothetical protein
VRYLLPISSAERFTTRQQGCQRVRRRVYTISRPRPLTRAHAAGQVSSPTKAKRAPGRIEPRPSPDQSQPRRGGKPSQALPWLPPARGQGSQAVQVQVSLCGKLSQPLASGSPSAQGKADKPCKRTRRRAGEGRRACKRFPHGGCKDLCVSGLKGQRECERHSVRCMICLAATLQFSPGPQVPSPQ